MSGVPFVSRRGQGTRTDLGSRAESGRWHGHAIFLPGTTLQQPREPTADAGDATTQHESLSSPCDRNFTGSVCDDHRRPVVGLRREADIVFPRLRVAVFVDSCFWHGCEEHVTWPVANAEWWRSKIERTRGARPRYRTARLADAGWTSSVRVWEHDDPSRLRSALRRSSVDRRDKQDHAAALEFALRACVNSRVRQRSKEEEWLPLTAS